VSDRFYYDGHLSLGPVDLEGPEAHHLAHVRRFAVGDRVVLFNGDGSQYLCEIREVGKKRVALEVVGSESPLRDLPFRLHLAVSMPKGDRGDYLLEKLVEVGVTDFTPLSTERSVVKVDDSKLEKLQRQVIEASKQCGRNVLMKVHPVQRWSTWSASLSGPRFIAHPGGSSVFAGIGEQGCTIAIGPEGGFSDAEVEMALQAGWSKVSLGSTILRVETAAVVAAVLAAKGTD
jgi:16S rRNA (uracil1498-N3)-methyltransferase